MNEENDHNEQVSNWWYAVAFLMGIVGGIIAWLVNKDKNSKKAKNFLFAGIIFTIILAGARMILVPIQVNKAKNNYIVMRMNEIKIRATIFASDNENSYVGLKDYFEIKEIQSDIARTGGTNFNLNSSETEYCAEVQLDENEWYCIDMLFNTDSYAIRYDANPACSANHFSCK